MTGCTLPFYATFHGSHSWWNGAFAWRCRTPPVPYSRLTAPAPASASPPSITAPPPRPGTGLPATFGTGSLPLTFTPTRSGTPAHTPPPQAAAGDAHRTPHIIHTGARCCAILRRGTVAISWALPAAALTPRLRVTQRWTSSMGLHPTQQRRTRTSFTAVRSAATPHPPTPLYHHPTTPPPPPCCLAWTPLPGRLGITTTTVLCRRHRFHAHAATAGARIAPAPTPPTSLFHVLQPTLSTPSRVTRTP